jgi:predicted secreted protein
MMSNADIGHGALFGIEGSTPGTYVTAAEVVAITPPGMTRDSVEVTHLTSPGKWKEYIAGLKDAGEASFTFNFVPSATDTVFAAFNADKGKYQITFPNGVMLRFPGFFTGYTPPELGAGEKMEASASIKATGPVTLHAPAGG